VWLCTYGCGTRDSLAAASSPAWSPAAWPCPATAFTSADDGFLGPASDDSRQRSRVFSLSREKYDDDEDDPPVLREALPHGVSAAGTTDRNPNPSSQCSRALA
jgi:hypothetical protein